MTIQDNTKSGQTEDFIRIQVLYLCISKWYWLVVSAGITFGIALFYLLITPPVYTRSASILIKEESKGQSLSGEIGSSFSDLGLFQANTNVNNELLSLQSPAVMLDVVKRLRLDVNYMTDGRFYRQVLYGQNLPVTVSFSELQDNESAAFTVNALKDGSVELSDFIRNNEDPDRGKTMNVKLNVTIATPVGKIIVKPTLYYDKSFAFPVYVSRTSLHETMENYASNLSVALSDEKASVIALSCKDVCIQRAEDVLNTLISVYNENWVKDKNQIAISTSMFINERLGVIERELGNVDDDISSYKKEHLLPDVRVASNMYMVQNSETNARILTLNTQLSMAQYIRNYLTNASSRNQLLPANSGLESANIEQQISEYNTMQLQRNNLVGNSSERNPLVADLDQSLKAMRDAIISSIDNLVVTLNTQIKNLRQSEQQTTARIAANPTQAKYLLSVERQQKVKEALYLFLLQKREENELSQAFTAYNTRVIAPPSGKMTPTTPVKRNILPAAFVLGLLIPVAVLFIRENMNTTVRGRKDLANLTIPFVGEIPLAYRKKYRLLLRKQKEETRTIVVKEKSRNVINEAFRVVRTNLEFMVGKDDTSKIIMISSANSGSGKTFISINLAISLAIKGKRVLLIDLDLRKASLSAYADSSKTGISDFLSGQIDGFSDIIIKDKFNPNLDVIPVGTIPPNPTELLFTEHLGQMLKDLRAEYDYIFIDCPPVEIVADAAVINKLSDMTLFIIRAGLFDRGMLPEIEKFYTEHKYGDMSLILNGTDGDGGRYGREHGYKYGYHYGYGGYAKED
jgi:capsular exopolysaccharide synthesis family protein